jgi:ACR3 family arsenite transporter
LGIISRYALIHLKGEDWFQNKYVPHQLLLYSLVIMFSLKEIVQIPMDVVRIAIPLVIYFTLMFVLSFMVGSTLVPTILKVPLLPLQRRETISNWQVAIGVFGINSGQAFAGVIGPLVEVPALIALVNVAFGFEKNTIQPLHKNLNHPTI